MSNTHTNNAIPPRNRRSGQSRSQNRASAHNTQIKYRNRQLALCFLLIALCCAGFYFLYNKKTPSQDTDTPPNIPVDAPVSTTTAPQNEEMMLETTTVATSVFVVPDKASIAVEPVLQLPELPTGCEVTSLTILLNYLGYDITKTELANDFLPISANGGVSFNDYFVGSPYVDTSFGCFAPVIVKTAEDYFNSILEEGRTIENLTGATPDELYEQVALGNPVIVWASTDLKEPKQRVYWNLPDGTPEIWFNLEHCMVLTGYDKTNRTATFCDPQKGVHTYNMDTFELRYSQLLSQAVIIY